MSLSRPAAAVPVESHGKNDVIEPDAHDDQAVDEPDGVTVAANPDTHDYKFADESDADGVTLAACCDAPAGPAGHAVLMAAESHHDAVAFEIHQSCQSKAGWMHPVRAVPLCGSSADQPQVCVTEHVWCCLCVAVHQTMLKCAFALRLLRMAAASCLLFLHEEKQSMPNDAVM